MQFGLVTLLIVCVGASVAAEELAVAARVKVIFLPDVLRAGLWGTDIILAMHLLRRCRLDSFRKEFHSFLDVANLMRGTIVLAASLTCHWSSGTQRLGELVRRIFVAI